MGTPLVSVGLVTWNSALSLPVTLRALSQQLYPAIELIVVDNGSKDDSVALVSASCPTAQFILNADNRGYCGGHNQAICASHGDYYLPLNPDVVMQPGYIAALVDGLEAYQECGSAAGKLLRNETGILDSTGLFLDRRRRQYLRGHGERDIGKYDQAEDVFGVDGAAPLYRRAMLDAIRFEGQFFDESFFAHKEDVDLAWRAQLAGWKCWYTPQATAIHPRNFRPGIRASVSAATRLHAVKNRYLLLLKNESPEGWRRDWLPILWYDLQIAIYLLLFEQSSLAAWGIVWKQRMHIQAWRRHIQAARKIQSQDLLNWFK